MNRITELFQRKDRNLLSVYFTAGYPVLEDTVEIIQMLENRGVDLVEIGFIYMVSSASTTGVKDRFTAGQIEYFQRIDRLNLKNKRLIGFGISNGESLSTVCRYSSGAIIGSLFVKLLGTEPTVEEAVDHLLKIAHGDGL